MLFGQVTQAHYLVLWIFFGKAGAPPSLKNLSTDPQGSNRHMSIATSNPPHELGKHGMLIPTGQQKSKYYFNLKTTHLSTRESWMETSGLWPMFPRE